jgi:hypothetical protein
MVLKTMVIIFFLCYLGTEAVSNHMKAGILLLAPRSIFLLLTATHYRENGELHLY